MENWRKYTNEISTDTEIDAIPAPLRKGKEIDPLAKTIKAGGFVDPRSKLSTAERRERHRKLELLQSVIELRNVQNQWLIEYNPMVGKDPSEKWNNILDRNGEEFHIGTVSWSIKSIEKMIKFFQQGLGASGLVKQAAKQRKSAGVKAKQGFLEEDN
jgi:hypothetical protein